MKTIKIFFAAALLTAAVLNTGCEKDTLDEQLPKTQGFIEYQYKYNKTDDKGNVVPATGIQRVIVDRVTVRKSEPSQHADKSRRIDVYLYPVHESGLEAEAAQYIHAELRDSLINLDGLIGEHYKIVPEQDWLNNPKNSYCLNIDGVVSSDGTMDQTTSHPYQISETLNKDFRVLENLPGKYQIVAVGTVDGLSYTVSYVGPVTILKD